MNSFRKPQTGKEYKGIFSLQGLISVLILLVVITLMTGCRRNSFTVSGTITGAGQDEYLLLRKVRPGFLEPIDSMIPDRSGQFRFKGTTDNPSFYMLSMGNNNFLTLLASPGEKIKITASRDSLFSPSLLTGSDGTSMMLNFRKEQLEVIDELQHLTDIFNENEGNPELPLIMDSLDRRAAGIVEDFREKSLKLIEDNSTSMVSIYLLNQQVVPGLQLFDPVKNPGIFYRVDSALYAIYPESDLVLDLHTFVAGLRKSVTVSSAEGTMPTTGMILPDIALPDPDGDTLRLSSTRGNIVLVDFWAAWCPPCREQNADLVELYNLYHRRGFDIFQVSLDLRKDEWTEAIRNDRLGRWEHVSDLKYRDSEVVKRFGLTEIPASFLLDRDGRIIAINLSGDDLHKKLEELLGRQ